MHLRDLHGCQLLTPGIERLLRERRLAIQHFVEHEVDKLPCSEPIDLSRGHTADLYAASLQEKQRDSIALRCARHLDGVAFVELAALELGDALLQRACLEVRRHHVDFLAAMHQFARPAVTLFRAPFNQARNPVEIVTVHEALVVGTDR